MGLSKCATVASYSPHEECRGSLSRSRKFKVVAARTCLPLWPEVCTKHSRYQCSHCYGARRLTSCWHQASTFYSLRFGVCGSPRRHLPSCEEWKVKPKHRLSPECHTKQRRETSMGFAISPLSAAHFSRREAEGVGWDSSRPSSGSPPSTCSSFNAHCKLG